MPTGCLQPLSNFRGLLLAFVWECTLQISLSRISAGNLCSYRRRQELNRFLSSTRRIQLQLVSGSVVTDPRCSHHVFTTAAWWGCTSQWTVWQREDGSAEEDLHKLGQRSAEEEWPLCKVGQQPGEGFWGWCAAHSATGEPLWGEEDAWSVRSVYGVIYVRIFLLQHSNKLRALQFLDSVLKQLVPRFQPWILLYNLQFQLNNYSTIAHSPLGSLIT